MGVMLKSISLAFVALLMTGCAPRFEFEGSWKGRRDLSAEKDLRDDIRQTLERVEIKIDGSRFEMFEAGVPKAGRVAFGSDRATLFVESVLGRPSKDGASVEIRGVAKDQIELLSPIPVMLRLETRREGGP